MNACQHNAVLFIIDPGNREAQFTPMLCKGVVTLNADMGLHSGRGSLQLLNAPLMLLDSAPQPVHVIMHAGQHQIELLDSALPMMDMYFRRSLRSFTP